jgi:hypothetical protein
MQSQKYLFLLLLLALLAGCGELPTHSGAGQAHAGDTRPQLAVAVALNCPSGWKLVQSGRGVMLCSRQFWRADGSVITEYVQVIDLWRGARVHSTLEGPAATSTQPSPIFTRRTVVEWWKNYSLLTNRFCMVNGAWFNYPWNGRLSFPLKNNSTLYSTGYVGDATWKSMLILDGGRAWVKRYYLTTTNLDRVRNELSSYRTVIVARYEENEPDPRDGRTLAGVRDVNGDGVGDVVLFYTSPDATTKHANSVLRSIYRATGTIQLDGGGSSQLLCRGTHYQGNRSVPHVFTTFEAVQ